MKTSPTLSCPTPQSKASKWLPLAIFWARTKRDYSRLARLLPGGRIREADHDSDVGVEIWLPVTHWKGIFHGDGNGGFGGSLAAGYAGMEAGLRRGYASATTDMGTAPATALNGDPLIGHPRKWLDWGLLSTHLMTVTGKAIAKNFYGEAAKHSYYTGCSTGGQQGLIEAQYYPDDYDGILVGAPVVNRTWGHAAAVWDDLSANSLPGRKLSDAKLTLLHNAVLSACGAKGNGLSADPFVSDPLVCKLNPSVLTCKGTDTTACLTPAEVQTAKDFYSGPVNLRGIHFIMDGYQEVKRPFALVGVFLKTHPMTNLLSGDCLNGCSVRSGTGANSISFGICPKWTPNSGRT